MSWICALKDQYFFSSTLFMFNKFCLFTNLIITYLYTFINTFTLISGTFEACVFCNSQFGTTIKITDISINGNNILNSSESLNIQNSLSPSKYLING